MSAITEAARAEWAYEQMGENYKAGRDVWVEVSDDFRQQALEVLPPIYRRGGFLVSEPYTHNAEGRPVYAGFATIGGRDFARYATPSDFERLAAELRASLSTLEG